MLFALFESGLDWINAALRRALPAKDAAALKVNVTEAPEASDGLDQFIYCPDTTPPPESVAPVNDCCTCGAGL